MNTRERDNRHWTEEWFALRRRSEADPDSFTEEDGARLKDLEAIAAIEGPEAVLQSGLAALWKCLYGNRKAAPSAPGEDADAPERVAASRSSTTPKPAESAPQLWVGAESIEGPLFWVSGKSIDEPHPLENILDAADRRGEAILRIRHFGEAFEKVEQADDPILELQGTHVIVIVPKGIALRIKGIISASEAGTPIKYRRGALERMQFTFVLDDAKRRVVEIRLF